MELLVLTEIKLEYKQWYQLKLLEYIDNKHLFYLEENSFGVATNWFPWDNVVDLKKHIPKEKFEKVK